MKLVIQVAKDASVTINHKETRSISHGFVVLAGFCESDTKEIADKMIRKMLGLRIFQDENGKTNLSLKQIQGEILFISQFTLYADCKKGNRPAFVHAAGPDIAKPLYEYCISLIRNDPEQIPIQTGEFGADMQVQLINDGPFTIILDSQEILPLTIR